MIILKYKVYKHTNKINGKVYIGITHCVDPNERWKNGLGYKPYGKNSVSHLHYAIEKYGWGSFESEILYSNLSFKEACLKEVEMIKKHKATDKNYGYNKHPGGLAGVPLSKEAKMKISIANKGIKNGMYGRTGKQHPMFNKTHTSEVREKLRRINIGKTPWNKGKVGIYSEETRKKISEAHKGNKYNLGKKHTEETKKKIGENTKKQWENEKFRQLVSEVNIGNKNSAKRVVCGDIVFDSIIDCAEYLGVHKKTVSRWLRGIYKIPEKYQDLNIRYENTEITE